MKWFYRSKVICQRKIHNTVIIIWIGLSYSPLQASDKKTLFRFKRIEFISNCYKMKFLLFDLSIIFIPKINKFRPELESQN